MSDLVMEQCLRAYPKRPKLNAAEWPYTREDLESRVDFAIVLIERALKPAMLFTENRQLIHKGRKP